jgi:hypothetical protein
MLSIPFQVNFFVNTLRALGNNRDKIKFLDVLKRRLFLTTDPGGDQQRRLWCAVQPTPSQEETLHRLREEVAAVPRQLQQVHH